MEWHTWYNLIKHNLAKKPSEKTLEKEERRDEEEMKVLDSTLDVKDNLAKNQVRKKELEGREEESPTLYSWCHLMPNDLA